MPMLDGNTAALRDHDQRQSFIDSVFASHQAEAARQLREEAAQKFPEADVSVGATYDEILGDPKAEPALAMAVDLDDALECLRLLKVARTQAAAATRARWVSEHVEERVWLIYNRGE